MPLLRRATAAVARCIVFPDVLSFAEDSSRILARNAPIFCGKYFRAGPPAASTCQEATSVSEPRQYLEGKVFDACCQLLASTWGKHFGSFLLRWFPACHLLFFGGLLAMVVVVTVGVVVLTELKHSTNAGKTHIATS